MEIITGQEIRYEIKERASYLEILNILVNIKSSSDGMFDVRTVEDINIIVVTVDDEMAEKLNENHAVSSFKLDIEDTKIITIIPEDMTNKAMKELENIDDMDSYIRVEY